MSSRLRRNSMKWDSSTEEEEDICETKHKMRLRETLRSTQQTGEMENEMLVEPRKRGRGPSKRPCLNRNALMARENRLRKKAYLEKIEKKLSFYQQENKNLVNIIRKQAIDIKRLTGEVSYLKSVLHNDTSITALLKTINDGLRKISTQKRQALHSNNTMDYTNELNVPCKSTYCMNLKENVLNVQNANMFITNMNKESLVGNGITVVDQNGETFGDNKKLLGCKNSCTDKTCVSFSDSDHTYTVSKTPTVDTKKDYRKRETMNGITSTTSSLSKHDYLDNTEELESLLPITQPDLHSVEEKKSTDGIGIDLDQLSTFNMDIFEDLPKCDEMLNTMDSLNDTSNLFTEEEISQTLNNTGICLHVNSDKVSLEFCSICHLNSKNSGLN